MQRSEYVEEMLGDSLAQADRLDGVHKVLLAIVSLATIAFIMAAALKEGPFSEWRRYQKRYAKILQDKATDDWGRQQAGSYEIKMQQIVVPKLGVVDRCVSCHRGIDDPRMTDVPQPFAVHPGSYLNWHDPNDFGCTICHRGQGRAMNLAEAKAEGKHWDYPLLPTEYAQSACGLCHSAEEIAEEGGEVYAQGEKLYRERGCASCHKLSGRGGGVGLALDRTGAKIAGELLMTNVQGPHTLPQWLKEHFDDPQAIATGSQMPPSQLSDDENVALTTYVLSLQSLDLPGSYVRPEKLLASYNSTHPMELDGQKLFSQYCAPCHDTGRYGRYDKFFKRFMPAIRGATYVQVASPDYVKKSIRTGRPGTLMFGWDAAAGGLSAEEIDAIAAYLLTPAPPEGPGAPPARQIPGGVLVAAHDPSQKIAGDPSHGEAIFAKHCTACHGPAGNGLLGPALSNQAFQAAATDGLIYATIAYGRAGTAMPSFLGNGDLAFAQGDIDDLVSYLRSLGSQPAGAQPGGAPGKGAK